MDRVKPYFGIFWGAREQNFGQFVDQTRDFLRGLQRLHPVFESLYVLGDRANAEKPLGAHLEHLDELALARGWNRKSPAHWFSHLDENGRPTRETLVDVGWRLSIVNEPESGKTDGYVNFSITSGQSSERVHRNSVLMKVQDPGSPLLDATLSRKIFHYMIDFWRVDRGWLTEESFRDAVWDDATLEQLGRLNYRADPDFTQFLPAGVPRESLGEGVLFRVGDGRVLSERDFEEVRIGRAIQVSIKAGKQR